METLYYISKGIHITCGAIALITGLIAMLSPKGGKRHRLNGKIYFWSMAVIFVTSLHMAFYSNIIFLVFIAFFSFQSAFSGYRILYLKKLHEGQQPETLDRVALIIGVIASLGMLGLAAWVFRNNPGLAAILVVFGALYTRGVWADYRKFKNPPTGKLFWYYIHIGQMSGAYIATVTAFLVNNGRWFPFIPGIVLWLLPTAVGGPLIFRTVAKYKKKHESGYKPIKQ